MSKQVRPAEEVIASLLRLRNDLASECLGRPVTDPEARIAAHINSCLYSAYETGQWKSSSTNKVLPGGASLKY